MKTLAGWFDSPIETFKAKYNEVIAKWNDALAALDAERTDFYANQDFAQSDPDLGPQWSALDGKLSMLQSTIDNVSGAATSIVNFLRSVTDGLGITSAGVSGLGILPAIPWALVGLVAAGSAAVWALAHEVRLFNLDATNKRLAIENIARSQQGLPPLDLVADSSSSGGIFAGLSDVAKWATYAAIAFALLKLLEGKRA